jgi:hypothetical protein
VLGFRGHQDIGFGLKLLFKRNKYDQLGHAERQYLFTCNGAYEHGPYWWKQVCTLANIGYSRRGRGAFYRIHLNETFMNSIIPIFTLTTAVTAKDVFCDSFVVLHTKSIDVYEDPIQNPTCQLNKDSFEMKMCMLTNKRIHHGGLRGNAGFLVSIDPNQWAIKAPSMHSTLPICHQMHISRVSVHKSNMSIFRLNAYTRGDRPTGESLEMACAHRAINMIAFRHRLCMFCACLPEYFGGDQHTNKRMPVTYPPYREHMLPELKEHIVWFWHRMWTTRNSIRQKDAIMNLTVAESTYAHIVVVGDIHGSIHSLVRIIHRLVKAGYMDKNFQLSKNTLCVFLGDYVDYGAYGLEVLWTILCLHAINPSRVVVIGGNHEDIDQNEAPSRGRDSLKTEVVRTYDAIKWKDLRPHLILLYRCIPRGMLLRQGEQGRELHFSHGCMSPYIHKQGYHTQDQIIWSDIHQLTRNDQSKRGGNVRVYGTTQLEDTLRCDCP